MADLRFGAGIWMFCQFVDRYATDGYGPPATTLDAIARAGEVEGLEVLDINYPFGDGIGVADVKEALARHRLSAQAITPHIYLREFTRGAFTNPDPALRKRARDRCREGIEVARQLGAKYVKFWPGQDGYDYPLQADYGWLWEQSVGAVRELASAAPDMRFAIEYKLKEPRTHMFFCNAATTILAIQDMGVDNVGVVLDVGHSLFAKETPAEALRLGPPFRQAGQRRNQRQLARVGRRPGRRVDPPGRDVGGDAGAARDRLERAVAAGSVSVPRGSGCRGAREHSHHPATGRAGRPHRP